LGCSANRGIKFPQKLIEDAAAGEADDLDLAAHVADHHVAVPEDRCPIRAEMQAAVLRNGHGAATREGGRIVGGWQDRVNTLPLPAPGFASGAFSPRPGRSRLDLTSKARTTW
jgi:hypothetical protein